MTPTPPVVPDVRARMGCATRGPRLVTIRRTGESGMTDNPDRPADPGASWCWGAPPRFPHADPTTRQRDDIGAAQLCDGCAEAWHATAATDSTLNR